jgi:putative ABC transport system ATP-binding protein
MEEPAITCKNLHKYYGKGSAKVHALRGVDLTVNTGELRMLMGPSGSGKTTLISIIAGILTQDEGECQVDHTDLKNLSDAQKTRYRGKNIGFVFQAFNLIPMLTTEENISVPLILNGTPAPIALEKAKELLIKFGMEDKIGSYPADLSGGQQQRIAIARAVVHQPRLIVCDEPTSFLDHQTGHMIMELLREKATQDHITILIVTHDVRITEFADKIDYLEDGKIVTQKLGY